MTRVNYKCLCWIVFCVSALLGFQRAVAAPPPAEQNINYMRIENGASFLGHNNTASAVPVEVLGSGGLNDGLPMFNSSFVPTGGSYSAEGMIFTSDDSQAFNEPSASNVTTWKRDETSGYAVVDLHAEREINKIIFYQVNTSADGRVSGAQVRVWLDNSVPPSSAVLPGSAGWTDSMKAEIILPFSDVTIPYTSKASVSNTVFRSDVRYLLYEFTQTGDNFLEVPKVWMGYDNSIPEPEVIISKTNSVTDENGGTDTFTVVLSGFQPTSPVEITLASSDTGEATVAPSTLTFTSADWNVPQVVTITGVDDAIIGVDHSATITVAVNPAASDDTYDSLSSQTVSVLLNNDDIDNTRPTVAISHSSAPATAGQPLRIEENTATVTFTFSEDVSDFDLTDVGVTSGALTNLSGSGSSYTALFTAPAGVETDSVISIADNTFSDATGNFNADGSDADNQVAISVDTLRPTLAMSADKSALTAGETATITFAFSEAVQQFNVGDVIVTGGTLGSFTGSGNSYTAVFTPDGSSTSGVMSVDSGRFADLAFNVNDDGGDADNQVTLPIDATPPTVAVSSSASAVKAGETATITFAFSEDVSDFDLSDVNVTSGGLANLTGSGSSYTAVFTPAVDVEVDSVLSIADNTFSDVAGNANDDGSDANNQVTISVDTLKPTLAMSASASAVKAGETAVITFTFSEAVQQFTLGDVIVTGGSLGSFTGSGSSYTAVFTPAADSEADGVMSVASGRFADMVLNINDDGSDANNQVTISVDTLRPTLTMSADKSALIAGETAVITFAFSEAVQQFNVGDVIVTGGTLGSFTGSGNSYTAVFTPDGSSTSGVMSVDSGRFADLVFNANNDGSDADNQVTLSIDVTLPTVAVSASASAVKAGETATVTFTFSEDVSDFDLSDVNVTNGGLANLTGSGSSYTAVFTPAVDVEVDSVLSIADNTFNDVAGNANADGSDANNQVTISVDTLRPTLTMSADKSALTAGETATITFAFSEAVQQFTLGDVIVTGGTLGSFTGSGSSYTAVFTPDGSSTSGVMSVASGRFADMVLNINDDGGDANNQVTLSIDATLPTVAVSASASAVKAGETATITFTFSEDVSDFDLSDVNVTNGGLANLTGSGSSYTAVFTPAVDVEVDSVLSIADNTFSDAAGNVNADGSDANNQVTISVDTLRPTLAMSADKSALIAGETATITFAFSEVVQQFTLGDVIVTGGTLGSFTGSGSSYTAVFTPAADSEADGVMSVASGRFADMVLNINDDGGDANNQVTISVDTSIPAAPTANTVPNPAKDGDAVTTTVTGVEAGASVDVPGMVCTPNPADATGIVECTGVVGAGGLDETAMVTVSDAAGNTATTSAGLTVDNTAPDAPTANTVPNPAKDGDAVTTTVTGVEAGASVDVPGMTCTPNPADATGIVECTGVVGAGGLDETAMVTVSDAAGNTATTSAGLTVDNTAPDAPTANTVPNPAKDGDAVTTTVTGVEAGASVDVPGMVCTPNPADATGIVECTGVVGAGGLDETAMVTVTDAAGNTATASAGLTVDNTPPAAPTANTVPNPAKDGDAVTTTVTGVEAGASVDVPGMTCTPNPADATGIVECTGVVGAGGLDETAMVTVTDAAGNTATTSAGLTVDNTAPDAPTANTVPNPAKDGDAVTTTVTGVEAGASVDVPGMTCTPNPADATGIVECTGVVGAGGLDETAMVTVSDAAGNTATTSAGLTVDNTAPAAPTANTVPNPAKDGDAVTTTVTGVEAGASVDVPGMVCTPNPADATGIVECTGVVGAGGLDENATVTVSDAAGNTATASAGLTVDNTPPVAPTVNTVPNPAKDGDAVTTTVTGVEAGASVDVPGMTCTPNPADATGIVECTGVVGAGGLDETAMVTVTDAAGNTATASAGLTVDNTAPDAPTVNTVPNPAKDGDAATTTVTGVEAGASVDVPGMTCTPNPADATGIVICTGVVGLDGFDENATVTVTDAAGNTATTSAGLTVDNSAPVAPTANTVPNPAKDGDAVTTTVTGVEAGASVDVPGMTCTPNPADATGIVECTGVVGAGGLDETAMVTVSDAAGNTATTSAGLTVDNTPPDAPTANTVPNPAKDGDAVTTTVTGVEAGASVDVPGMVCTPNPADATGIVECTGVVGAGGLDETAMVTVTDAAGNTATTSAGLTVDNTPPDAPTANTVPNPAKDGDAVTTTVTGVEAGASVDVPGMVCTPNPADATGIVECTGVVGAGGLDETAMVTVTDAAGNTATTSAGLTVDNTAPDAPTANTVPNPAKDGDAVTTTVTGVEAGASVDVPGMVCTPNPADATGIVECTGVVGAGGLDETAMVTVSDAAGNTATTSAGLTVDNTAPDAPTANTVPNPAKDGDAVTTTVTGVEAGASVDVPGMVCTPNPADATGIVECTGVVGAGGLDENATVTVSDAAGNTATASAGLTVDNTPPVAPTVNTVPNPAKDGDAVTTTVTGVEAGASVDVPGMTCTPNPADATGIVECTGVVGAGGLDETAMVTVTDAAGNTATASAGLTVDNTAPDAPTANTVPNPAKDGDAVTTTVTGVEAGASVDVPGMTCTPNPADATGIVECTGVVGAGGLDETAMVTVSDAAGNTATASAGLTVDNTAPDAPTANTVPNPAKDGDAVTTTVTGVEAGASVDVPGMVCTPNPADATGVVVCTGVVGVDGLDANATVTVTDAAGNTATASAGLEVDNSAPAAPTVNTVPNPAKDGDAVTTTVTGVEAGASVDVPGMVCTPNPADATGIVECTGVVGAGGLDETAMVTVTDAAGNTATTSAGLTVDNTAPDAPTANTVPNPAKDGDAVTTTVTGVEAGASVDVPGMTCTPNPADATGIVECTGVVGAGGLDGTAMVTVSDAAGNTATASAGLTVDNTAPDAPTANTVPNPAKDGDAVTTTVTGVEVGASVDVPGMTCTPNPADATGIVECTGVVGAGGLDETAMVTVSDAAGNTATASAGLTVDNTAPDAPTANTVPNPAKDGDAVTTTVTGVEAGASVDVPGMVCTPNPADATGVVVCTGVVGVDGLDANATVTVTDAAGNTATASAGLEVDNSAPAAPTVNTVPNPAKDGDAVTTTVTGVEAGASVDVPGMTCTPNPADATGIVECTGVAGVAGLDANATVTVTDAAGNTAMTSAGLEVDNIAPEVVSVTGVISGNTLTVSGECKAPGDTVTVVVPGADPETSNVPCSETGNFDVGMFTVSVNIASLTGTISFQVSMDDAAGNSDSANSSVVIEDGDGISAEDENAAADEFLASMGSNSAGDGLPDDLKNALGLETGARAPSLRSDFVALYDCPPGNSECTSKDKGANPILLSISDTGSACEGDITFGQVRTIQENSALSPVDLYSSQDTVEYTTTEDNSYDYFSGMVEFQASCSTEEGTDGAEIEVTLAFTGWDATQYPLESVVMRKYSPQTGQYYSLAEAGISEPLSLRGDADAGLLYVTIKIKDDAEIADYAKGSANEQIAGAATSKDFLIFDPIGPAVLSDAGRFVLDKRVNEDEVSIGDVVRYTITGNAVEDVVAPVTVRLKDVLPAGVLLKGESVHITKIDSNGQRTSQPAPQMDNASEIALTLMVASGERFEVSYLAVISAGATLGEKVNRAELLDGSGKRVSNVAEATVRVGEDPILDKLTVIGKVFNDINANGVQDPALDERGLAGVQLVTLKGQIITTDAYGRFHIPAVSAGYRDHGRNFYLKVDPSSLPAGYEFTTENPRVIRITPGLMTRINFGVRAVSKEGDKTDDQEAQQILHFKMGQLDAERILNETGLVERLSRIASIIVGLFVGEAAAADIEQYEMSKAAGNASRVQTVADQQQQVGDATLYASLQVTPKPRLSVGTGARGLLKDGKLQGVTFYASSNYTQFIDEWVLRVYRANDTAKQSPVLEHRSDNLMAQPFTWNGKVASGKSLRVGEQLFYELEVKDKLGNRDLTRLKDMTIVSELGADERLEDLQLSEPYLQLSQYDDTQVRSIVINGSRIIVKGQAFTPETMLTIAGLPVQADEKGRVNFEYHQGVGDYDLPVIVNGQTQRITGVVKDQYMLIAALADLTTGKGRVRGGDTQVEEAKKSDYFDNDIYVDGRVAFYLKGKIKGKYLLTAQMDTTEGRISDILSGLDERNDTDSLLERIDPERYYPVYGDGSSIVDDVNTQGKFYVRVDWDHSQVVWGNYRTNINGTQLSEYNRTLYGGKVDYRSVKKTQFNDHQVQLTGFVSKPTSLAGRDEFLGTGGRLYYLKNTDVVLGSENLWVEVRDRVTDRVISRRSLSKGIDYQFNAAQGRIFLEEPLRSRAGDDSIVYDEPVDGDRVVLVAGYEYEASDTLDDTQVNAGGRAKVWLNDHIGIGVMAVNEEEGNQHYEKNGVDVVLKLSNASYVAAEYAKSENQQLVNFNSSNNGGLTQNNINNAGSGDAYRVDARLDLQDVSQAKGAVNAWTSKQSAGFESYTRTGEAYRQHGIEGRVEASDKLGLAARVVRDDRQTTADRVQLQTDYKVNERLTVSGEYRYDDAGADHREAVAAQGSMQVNQSTRVYAAAQQQFNEKGSYAAGNNDNANEYTVGVETQVGNKLRLNAEGSDGDLGRGIRAGASYSPRPGHDYYANADLLKQRNGDRERGLTLGQRSQVNDKLSVYQEYQYDRNDRYDRGDEVSLDKVWGARYQINKGWGIAGSYEVGDVDADAGNDVDRKSGSVRVDYKDRETQFSHRIEVRIDDYEDGAQDEKQYLSSVRYRRVLNDEFTLLTRVDGSVTKRGSNSRVARFADAQVGLAFRPVAHDKLNLLGLYRYVYDLAPESQSPSSTDEQSHILSLDAVYELTERVELGGKIAHKQQKTRILREVDDWVRSGQNLIAIRGRYMFIKRNDVLLEYRLRDVSENGGALHGVLAEYGYHIGDHMRVSAGYNFAGFNDDLGDEDYDREGWFVNMVGKY